MAGEGSPIVLFRHISLRERWARHLPTRGQVLVIALVCIVCVVFLDYLNGRVAHRALAELLRLAAA